MKALTAKFLKKFLDQAAQRLKGDWVLLGGTLLPSLGVDHRVTTDIDLVPIPPHSGNQTLLTLMELAEELGLPVEAVNSAAGYFLEKIPNYRDALVILKESKQARIYRPDATLYLQLKIGRLTDSDLEDCLQWLKWVRKRQEPLLRLNGLRKRMGSELKKAQGPPTRLKNLQVLLNALDAAGES